MKNWMLFRKDLLIKKLLNEISLVKNPDEKVWNQPACLPCSLNKTKFCFKMMPRMFQVLWVALYCIGHQTANSTNSKSSYTNPNNGIYKVFAYLPKYFPLITKKIFWCRINKSMGLVSKLKKKERKCCGFSVLKTKTDTNLKDRKVRWGHHCDQE